MREGFLGRSPRLTGYFCGIALGLALLVSGLEAARLLIVGELSTTGAFGFAAIGIIGGLALSFAVGYLNGGVLASWMAGFVPAAGRVGGPLAEGTLQDIAVAAIGAGGYGVLLGAFGFALAVEKHRHDAATADLPAPLGRLGLLVTLAVSGVVGSSLVTAAALL